MLNPLLDLGLGRDLSFGLPLDGERGGCGVRYGDVEPFLDVYLCKEEEDGEQDLELVVEEDRVEDLDRSMSQYSSSFMVQLYTLSLMW